MNNWIKIRERTVLDCGNFLRVDAHTLKLPDGRVIEQWPVITTPDYVNILARDRHGRFLFFKQTKYVAPALKLSPPGGYIEKGETPEEAAKRELMEETGYHCDQWKFLGRYVVDGNRGCGAAHLFLALDAEASASPQRGVSDDLEDQELVFLERADVEALLDQQASALLSIAALLALGLRQIYQTTSA